MFFNIFFVYSSCSKVPSSSFFIFRRISNQSLFVKKISDKELFSRFRRSKPILIAFHIQAYILIVVFNFLKFKIHCTKAY